MIKNIMSETEQTAYISAFSAANYVQMFSFNEQKYVHI